MVIKLFYFYEVGIIYQKYQFHNLTVLGGFGHKNLYYVSITHGPFVVASS